MERRTFLHLCTGAATALAAGAVPLADRASPAWRIDGRALFPGAPLHVTLAAHTPAGARVRLHVASQDAAFDSAWFDAPAGALLTLETPYPHRELVPGTYLVSLELRSRRGRLLERAEVGGYALTRHWFSA